MSNPTGEAVMMSNENLYVGTDGKVLVGRYRKASVIEMFALVRGEWQIFIKKVDGHVYTVKVNGSSTPIEIMANLAQASTTGIAAMNAPEWLDHLLSLGRVEGAVLYLGEDPFRGGWTRLVETVFEKAVTETSADANNDFELEI
jgi:hypothetical protein